MKAVFESEGQTCQNFDEAKHFLKGTFLSSSDQQSVLSQLMALKQASAQSLNDFHDKIQKLGKVAFVDINAEASDRFMMGVLINGLRSSNMCDHVDQQQPDKLTDAMHLAHDEEAHLNCRKEDEWIFRPDQNAVRPPEQ